MSTYKRLTLGELIESLEQLPGDAFVDGLDDDVDSYRGYYDRNSVAPGPRSDAHVLAQRYRAQIGKTTYGYKGGEYTVSADELVYLAGSGDTGPNIIGLMVRAPGVYEPILLREDWHF